jgi:hypothetical protein
MQARHRVFLSLLAGATTACDGGKAEQPEAEARCTLVAAPAAAPVGGDANGDGHVDVSDGAYLARALLAAGPAPVCDAGVDLVPDEDVNVGDVLAVWYGLGPKSAPYRPEVTSEACPEAPRVAEPPCGDGLALAIDAPAESTGANFDATVKLASPTLPAEAWSFTLTAEGCALDAGTTAGTDAADRQDGTGGLRDGGVAWQSVAPAEARVLTVLDWRRQGTLPTGGARPIHTFTVSATACGTCTLTLTAGDPAAGVESVVSGEGWRYLPALGSARVEVCPA